MSQRLTYFSQREPPYEDLAQLCENELAQIIGNELVALAGRSPRAALALADLLLRNHCRRSEPPDLIAISSWEQAKEIWRSRRPDFVITDGDANNQLREATPTASTDSMALDRPALYVEEEKHLVWLGKNDITREINPHDRNVLICLYRNHDRICTKDLLITEAWPDFEASGVSDQAVAASIARLRRTLKQCGPGVVYIETFRGRGYRLHPRGLES